MTKPNSPAPSLREAANQQIKQQFAPHFERDDFGTCGECLYLDGARCSLRGLLVEVKDPGCAAFDLREEQ